MDNQNPYQSPGSRSTPLIPSTNPPSRWRAALIGFAVGATLPVGFAVYLLYQESTYQASLPKGEEMAACGTTKLVAIFLMVVGGPLCGAVGAAFSVVAQAITRLTRGPATQS
jgi:hypothetical protein